MKITKEGILINACICKSKDYYYLNYIYQEQESGKTRSIVFVPISKIASDDICPPSLYRNFLPSIHLT